MVEMYKPKLSREIRAIIIIFLMVLVAIATYFIISYNFDIRRRASTIAFTSPEMPRGDFDAVSDSGSDNLYFFKGEYVYTMQDNVFTNVKKISEIPLDNPSIPIDELQDIDAATYVDEILGNKLNSIVMYKGSRYWRWDLGSNKLVTYGDISVFKVSLPEGSVPFPTDGNFDAALYVRGEDRILFYKDGNAWNYNPATNTVFSQYSSDSFRINASTDLTPEFPFEFDASVENPQGTKLFFYSGQTYWIYDNAKQKFVESGDLRLLFSETYKKYPTVTITYPERHFPSDSQSASLLIKDKAINGEDISYLIPYIQTDKNLTVKAQASNLEANWSIQFSVKKGTQTIATQIDTQAPFEATFSNLDKGEYEISVSIVNHIQASLWFLDSYEVISGVNAQDSVKNVGIGDIIAAVGDSITSGYYSNDFITDYKVQTPQDISYISSRNHASFTEVENSKTLEEMVSKDKRNFPQSSPMGDRYQESYLTDLNNLYSSYKGYPVFILNEGHPGITTGGYISTYIDADTPIGNLWRERITTIKPNIWTIHLGANDASTDVSTYSFDTNLKTILIYIKTVTPDAKIVIAKPSYYVSHTQLESTYLSYIDKLIDPSQNIYAGPDFFNYFSSSNVRLTEYHTEDNSFPACPLNGERTCIHPNPIGMADMAKMWNDALKDI